MSTQRKGITVLIDDQALSGNAGQYQTLHMDDLKVDLEGKCSDGVKRVVLTKSLLKREIKRSHPVLSNLPQGCNAVSRNTDAKKLEFLNFCGEDSDGNDVTYQGILHLFMITKALDDLWNLLDYPHRSSRHSAGDGGMCWSCFN